MWEYVPRFEGIETGIVLVPVRWCTGEWEFVPRFQGIETDIYHAVFSYQPYR